MALGLPALNDVGRHQLGQVVQPEARGLGLPVAKHPRLNDLVGLAVDRGHEANGVLYGPRTALLGHGAHQGHEEVYALLLATVCPLGCPMAGTGDAEVGTRRKADDQVP